MKRVNVFLILIILAIIYLNFNVNSAFVIKDSRELVNAYKNQSLVRLHVVANSNSPEDQYIKRRIRDEIIKYTAGNMVELELNGQEISQDSLVKLKQVAEQVIEQQGKTYPVQLEFGHYNFPKRTYGNLTLPAGEYTALKVMIGAGSGSNWWCVLLPPLCIETETTEASKPAIEFRFKLTELLGLGKKKAEPQPWLSKNLLEYKLLKLNLYDLEPEMWR